MQDALLNFIERRRWWLVGGFLLLAALLYLFGQQVRTWLDANADWAQGLTALVELAKLGALLLAALAGVLKRSEKDARQETARNAQALETVRGRAAATVRAMLSQSLERRLALPIQRRLAPVALLQAWPASLVDPLRAAASVDADARLATLFDQSGGALLVLGEAGSGKTVALLELADQLLLRGGADTRAPVPLYLTLSTWRDRKQPLTQWLTDQMALYYAIPRLLGSSWLAEGRLVLLLDGLDEMPSGERAACAQALNALRQDLGVVVPLAVACRSADYGSLPPLALGTAVELLPLSPQTIDACLDARPEASLAGLRALLASDASWRALAQSPLMLGVMTVAFADAGPELAVQATPLDAAGRTALLWDRYLVEALRRKDAAAVRGGLDRSLQQIAWLAQAMRARATSVLHLEALNLDWVPRARYLAILFTLGLLVGALAGAVGTGLIGARWFGRMLSVPQGMLVGAVGGAQIALFLSIYRHDLTDHQTWTLTEFLRPVNLMLVLGGLVLLALGAGAANVVVIVLHVGLFSDGLGSLLPMLRDNMTVEKFNYFWLKLLPIVLLLVVLVAGATKAPPQLRAVPNEGTLSRLRLALFLAPLLAATGLLGNVLFQLLPADDTANMTPVSLREWTGEALGLLFAGFLGAGGLDVVQHHVIRAALASSGRLPWRLVGLLEQATGWVLMQRVGGGYRFVHGLLMAHLADRAQDQAWRRALLAQVAARPAAGTSQPATAG